LPHRLLRRRLVGLMTVVLIGQISGVAVSLVQAWGAQGKADALTCCCCRRGSAGHCPVCVRTPHVSARCTCGCQDHDAAVPPMLDLAAVVPVPAAVFADQAARGVPAPDGSRVTALTPVPPSPPPWVRALGVVL
jgi:hypothetical protein